jgi:Tfp pilus assembly protein PilO
MKKTSPQPAGKPRTWLITALLAAMAVGYVVFVFLPLQKKIRVLRSDLQEKRQHVVQAQSLTGTIERAKQQLAHTREVSLSWQAGAPSAAELARHFANITQHARTAGVKVGRFEPQPAVEMEVLAQHTVNLHFQGQFQQAFDFIARLEQLPGSVWFRDVKLFVPDPTTPQLQGELTLTIFVDRADYAD